MEYERFSELHEKGQNILDRLFGLSDEELKKTIKIWLDKISEKYDHLFDDHASVTRTIHNEQAQSITVCCYDTIKINQLGIDLTHEHGNTASLLKFSNYFDICEFLSSEPVSFRINVEE